jgi:hypothetical protein
LKTNRYKKETPKWFRRKYKKFDKLVKKRSIHFFGIGHMPMGKNGIDFKVWDLFNELTDYEPFLEFVRSNIGVD